MSVTKNIRGSLYFSQRFQAFCVPTCTPALPETTIIAASAALTASSTSPTKSKYPGVSSTLIFTLSHGTGISVVEIEKCLLISSLSKSLTVFPSSTLPRRLVIPAR